MDFNDFMDSLHEYKGLVKGVKKGKKQELIRNQATTTNTITFFNQTSANIRVNKKDRIITIEYRGRIILDYDEVSLNTDKKAKQLAKLVTKETGNDDDESVKTFIQSEKEDLKKREKELKSEIKELKKQIKELKKEIEDIKRSII